MTIAAGWAQRESRWETACKRLESGRSEPWSECLWYPGRSAEPSGEDRRRGSGSGLLVGFAWAVFYVVRLTFERSEERRVGKECQP